MSDSIPPKSPRDPLHASAEQSVWVLASTLIHGALLALVLVLIPLCSVAPSLRSTEPSLSAEEVQKVAQQVEEVQRKELEMELERMKEALEKVRDEQARRESLLPEPPTDPADNAEAETASDAVRDAFELMEAALEAQTQAEESAEAAARADDPQQLKEAVDTATTKQAEADQLQREALNRLAESQTPLDPAIEAQMEAIAQQVKAHASLDRVRERLDAQQKLDEQSQHSADQAQRTRERELERWQGEEQRREEEVGRINQRLEGAREALQEAQSQRERAEHAHTDAEQSRNDQKTITEQRQEELNDALAQEREARQSNEGPRIDLARQKANEARQAINEAREAQKQADRLATDADRALKSAKGEEARQQRAVESAEKDLARTQAALDAAKEKASAAQATVAAAQAKADTLANTAKKHLAEARAAVPEFKAAQTSARTAQTEAIKALGKAMAAQASPSNKTDPPTTADADPSQPEAGEDQRADASEEQPAPDPASDTPSIAQLYDRARSLELQVARHYREASAAELALLQGISMNEARRQVDVPISARPDADQLISAPRPVRTVSSLQNLKSDLTGVRREVGAMADTAEAMAETAAGKDRAGLRVAGTAMQDLARQRIDAERGLAELARETAGSPAVDLSAQMAAADQIGKPAAAPGEAGEVAPKPDAGSHDPASGVGAAEMEEQEPVQPLLASRSGAAGAPPALTEKVEIMAGRRLTIHGPEVEWLYLDAWYLAGPFPNHGRSNIHRQFPPETVVDLDAVYSGAGGRTVKWEFVQSTKPMVQPENAGEYTIWYAYTEVSLEEAADLWIAVGSDDRSDIWINGMKVWASSDQLKAWRIGEGYRKVHFREGVNRILYRIENGHGGMGFSLVIHMNRPPEASD